MAHYSYLANVHCDTFFLRCDNFLRSAVGESQAALRWSSGVSMVVFGGKEKGGVADTSKDCWGSIAGHEAESIRRIHGNPSQDVVSAPSASPRFVFYFPQ